MTLRQVLDVLWKRKWIIVSVIAIALVTAAAYLQLRTETFMSSGTLRFNAVVTDAAYTGEIGGVAVDIDPSVVLSPTVLDPAAEELGMDAGTLGSALDISVDGSSRLAQLTVSAIAASPEAARDEVAAVLASFQAYVDEQVALALTQLQEAQTTATDTARDLQAVVAKDPADSISQTKLQTALQRMTSTTAAIDTINTGGANTIILRDPAPGSSTVPSAVIVLLLALLTGLIIGVAVALIRDQFDNRLRGEDEVEVLTQVRSIGELSWDRKIVHMDPPLPVASNERTDLSERLRTLRSNLAVFLPPREAAFVVTSVEPGDGKSFVSANLALAWARAGKRVILVGGDLRRPNLARYFGEAADGEGLADILEEHEAGDSLSVASVDSRLNSTRYRRLQVLPSGAEPSEPADLFARSALSEVISYLRLLADVVIIDSPPAMGMADAALLANHTDGAIVLATVRRTDRVSLTETIESLRAAGTEVLGVVTNRSRRKLPKSYSSYYISGSASSPSPPPSPAPAVAAMFELEDDVQEDEAPLRRRNSDTAEREGRESEARDDADANDHEIVDQQGSSASARKTPSK